MQVYKLMHRNKDMFKQDQIHQDTEEQPRMMEEKLQSQTIALGFRVKAITVSYKN